MISGIIIITLVTSIALAQDDEETPENIGQTGGTYILQPGDTLDVLGQRWNVSVVTLKQANDITDSLALRPGMTITIPPNSPPYGTYPPMQTASGDPPDAGGFGVSGETYVMQPGDVLDLIAQERNVSVVSIMMANGITNTKMLMPGTLIVIPDDAPPYGVFPATDQGGTAATTTTTDTDGQGGGGGGGDTYIVQPNDTLDGIAADHNVQTRCLAEANALENPKFIYPGQTIQIDRSCPPYDGYDIVGNK
jgi:LysM repeat protein